MKHWKTILFNAAAAAIGTLDAASLAQIIPPQHMGIALTLFAIVNMLLRTNLKPPVGSDFSQK